MWEKNVIYTREYSGIPFDRREILCYARCRGENAAGESLLDECVPKAEKEISFRVCYGFFDCITNETGVLFPFSEIVSADLASHLRGCGGALIFAATAGAEIDRLIARYSAVSPSRALMFSAIGTERVEALCDRFCEDIGREAVLTQRFSPGYGDLDIFSQKIFLSVLDASRLAGITLSESMLMSPSKSVTALCGVKSRTE